MDLLHWLFLWNVILENDEGEPERKEGVPIMFLKTLHEAIPKLWCESGVHTCTSSQAILVLWESENTKSDYSL